MRKKTCQFPAMETDKYGPPESCDRSQLSDCADIFRREKKSFLSPLSKRLYAKSLPTGRQAHYERAHANIVFWRENKFPKGVLVPEFSVES